MTSPFLANERRPQFFCKWKTTSIFLKMEDDLNFLENGSQPQFLLGNGRQLQFLMGNGRQLQYPHQIKTALIFQIQDN